MARTSLTARAHHIVGQLPRPATVHLGWAFLLAWVFCTFYLHSIRTSLGGACTQEPPASLGLDLAHTGVPLAISVAVLALIVVCERRLGPLAGRRAWRLGFPLLTALGTPLMCVPTGHGQLSEICFWAGALLTGVGSAPLWVMWGELYARLEQGVAEMTASLAAVLAALVALLCASLVGWAALAAVAALPLLSGFALTRAHVSTAPEPQPVRQTAPPLRDAVRNFGREGLGILVASTVVCYAGSLAPTEATLSVLQASLAFAIALACVVTCVSVLTPRRFNLQFLYRWMCPLVLACLACVIWFGTSVGGTLAFGGSIGARLAFCLLTQVYFARIAATGRFSAVQAFGLGWVCLHAGDLLGVALNVTLAHLAPAAVASAGCVMALGIVMVASVMFTLNGNASFGQAAAAPSADEGAPSRPPAAADPFAARIAELAGRGGLTAREAEVLALLARGRSNPYIRDALGISLDTTGTHVKHVYAKLGVHSRQELIDLARAGD